MKHKNWVKFSCTMLITALVLALCGCGKAASQPDQTLRLEATAATEITQTTAATEPTAETETLPEETLADDADHDHEYKEAKIVKPTCTTDGYTLMTCSCGESYESDKTAALGHKYTDKVVAPTTSERGYTLHTCKNCGSSYKDSYTNKLPSKPANPSKPAEPQKPAHTHSYTVTVVNPTCTEKGYTKHTCSGCANAYEDTYVEALGHTYSDRVVPPTCTEDGYTEHKCTVCSHSYKDNVVEKVGHKYKDTLVQPTCKDQGYTEHKCENCGDIQKDHYTDTVPHNYVDFYIEPTCKDFGVKGKRCEWCRTPYSSMTIPPDSSKHKFELVEEKEPTCADPGYTKHVCTVCGLEQKTETARPTGHNYQVTIIYPTCTEPGSIIHECSVCGDRTEETPDNMPALGHQNIQEVTIDNVVHIVCADCGEDLGPKEVAAEPPKKDETPAE